MKKDSNFSEKYKDRMENMGKNGINSIIKNLKGPMEHIKIKSLNNKNSDNFIKKSKSLIIKIITIRSQIIL
jgi:hypothetical protein